MRAGRPSATALRVAIGRASHNLLDRPPVLDDPLAVPILDPASALRAARGWRWGPMRLERAFVAARSRLAENEIARAHARGCRQAVVLGAGLDTFAWRNPYPGLVVFELDHPDTQAWKRARLAAAGLAPHPLARLVPVDFERDEPGAALRAAGFDDGAPAVFSWLGVTYYLSMEAMAATLGFVGGLAPGTVLVFDYFRRPAADDLVGQALLAWLRLGFAWVGEPWKTLPASAQVRDLLLRAGFDAIVDLDPGAIDAACFRGRADGLRSAPFGHVVSARGNAGRRGTA